MTSGAFEPGFRGGGPIRSIAQIVDTVPEGVELRLVTRDRDEGATEPYPGLSGQWFQRGTAQIFYLDTASPAQWWRLWRDLRTTPFDLMYVNSFWAVRTTVAPLLAALIRILQVRRILIAPRGEFSDGALSVKAGKKRALLPTWKRVLRLLKVQWHATAEHEIADIRRNFPADVVHLVPNQTALPDEPITDGLPSADHARLVYVSRIVINKRLHVALEALRHVANPVDLDIWGPIENQEYWASCQAIIAELPNEVQVAYRGELAPADVRKTFSDYDAFVFPTTGENFGHAIAESLSASCPVICTDTTPWTEVLEGGGGSALADGSVEEFGLELKRLSTMSAAERQQNRSAAARAYRDWKKTTTVRNILDVARSAPRAGES
ncbi:glycosyltransferase family 4 protein [Actinoplanes sp. NPDC051859]|uniref:glycosyltransferase family 4 protein n=1 Tax=Actinoplanes sp. NPDC051859 TaxID=3363909 RepID=UPI00379018AB